MKSPQKHTYIYNRFLALNPNFQLSLPDINYQILAFEISGDLSRNVEVADRLCPFIGKRSLFLSLSGTGCFISSGLPCRNRVSQAQSNILNA